MGSIPRMAIKQPVNQWMEWGTECLDTSTSNTIYDNSTVYITNYVCINSNNDRNSNNSSW